MVLNVQGAISNHFFQNHASVMELLEALQKSSITLEQLKVCEMFRLQSFIYILFFFCHGVRIDGTGIDTIKIPSQKQRQ